MARAECFKKLQSMIGDSLGVEESNITEASNFSKDLGADSLDLLELVKVIQTGFNIQVPDDELEKITTVGQAIDLIIEKSG